MIKVYQIQLTNAEIDMIAHSCGLKHAREFRREHLRIVRNAYESVALSTLYPYPDRPEARVKFAS